MKLETLSEMIKSLCKWTPPYYTDHSSWSLR